MRKVISKLASLIYRTWMLNLGYYCWCDKCHTIVSGGFGYTDKNNIKKFMCGPCAEKVSEIKKSIAMLKYGQSFDPIRREFND